MDRIPAARIVGLVLLLGSLAGPSLARAQGATPAASPAAGGVEIVANRLTNPRGFTWGDDGTLYLALGGAGGDQQPAPGGTPIPFMVGNTASVVSVADGCTAIVAGDIPSLFWADASWTWGAMDVATIAGELYVLAAGSIDPAMPNGIYRILDDGSLEQVIDLATWSADNPPAFTPPDYNAEGSWFDLESDGEKFWVSEAVGGRIVTVTREGAITLVADLSEGHMVPTGLALDGKGGAYVTYETTVPYAEGSSKVTHVAADGTTTDVWTGLTAVTDLVMGPDGVLYAAEMASQTTESAPYLAPGTGRVVRQTGPDSLEAVATDVPYPVDLGFDADGMLYVSGPAFGQGKAEGEGWLARIDPAQSPVSFAGIGDAPATCSTG